MTVFAPEQRGWAVTARIPARAELIPTARTLVADVAGRADFDIDAIADLRMAVDEACTILVRRARPGEVLRCEFAVDDGRIRVTAAVPAARPGAHLETRGFGWQVLRTLVDQLAAHTGRGADGEELVIEMVKQAGID
jgi:serine/threonine-protein kinase RsbW